MIHLKALSLSLILSLLFSIPLKADETDMKKINFLLKQIEISEAEFIRNGSSYKATDAAKHIAYKLKRATSSFFFFTSSKKVSVGEFIDKIASKSSISDKDYLIKEKGAKEAITMEQWLRKTLKKYQTK